MREENEDMTLLEIFSPKQSVKKKRLVSFLRACALWQLLVLSLLWSSPVFSTREDLFQSSFNLPFFDVGIYSVEGQLAGEALGHFFF